MVKFICKDTSRSKKSRYRRVNVYIISLLRYFPVLNLYLHVQTHTQVIYENKNLNHSQKKDMCSLHQWRHVIEFKHFFMHEEIWRQSCKLYWGILHLLTLYTRAIEGKVSRIQMIRKFMYLIIHNVNMLFAHKFT